MKHVSQKGFSVIVALLALLVLGGVGFGGWYVWQKNYDRDKGDAPSSSNHAPRSMEPESPKSEPPENKEYLRIKEWDLRITLPEVLQGDISYFVNDRVERDLGGPLLVDFTSKKFSAGSLKCATIENVPRSILSIYKEVGSQFGQTLEPSPFKTLGDTRYYFTETACAETIQREGSEDDRRLLKDLKEAIVNTLENYQQ